MGLTEQLHETTNSTALAQSGNCPAMSDCPITDTAPQHTIKEGSGVYKSTRARNTVVSRRLGLVTMNTGITVHETQSQPEIISVISVYRNVSID